MPGTGGDVIVLGAGLAGLYAALHLAEGGREVVVADAGPGSSLHARGGIAAVSLPDDSAELHVADTLACGQGLAEPEIARLVAAEVPLHMRRLAELGVAFDPRPGREGGHSRPRVVAAGGDRTGAVVLSVLRERVRAHPRVCVVEGRRATELLRSGARVGGVRFADGSELRAPVVVLATGGFAGLFRPTTNPPGNRGDGIAMAVAAGARVADLEFVQFHPTALAVPADPRPLLTEALRGAGARLVDGDGRPVMAGIDPRGDLAPRDVVAARLADLIAAGRRVFLDCRPVEELAERFPAAVAIARAHGFDPAREPLPVEPAAHYTMGGVLVDRWGRTGVPGLYAVGEVARTGLHGANRLASNSLAEALVFGARAARHILAEEPRGSGVDLPAEGGPLPEDGTADALVDSVRDLLGRVLRPVRTGAELARAGTELAELAAGVSDPVGRNVLVTARLAVLAAWLRRESRGPHRRADRADPDPGLCRPLVLGAEDLAWRGEPWKVSSWSSSSVAI